MNFKDKVGLLTIVIVVLLCGCKKSVVEETPALMPLIVEADRSLRGNPQIIGADDEAHMPTRPSPGNYLFDWEQAREMPGPQGDPIIPMPWADNASRQYDEQLRYDYKKSDGWELIYNTFTHSKQDNRYFILYNKFRGVLRYYVYYDKALPDFAGLSAFSSTLEVYGNSNLLNFADQHIVDVDENSGSVSVSDSYPLARHGWYIAQFEIAYDRNLQNSTYSALSIRWSQSFSGLFSGNLSGKNIQDAKLSIQQQGTNTFAHDLNGEIQLNFKSLGRMHDLEQVLDIKTLSGLERQMTGKDTLTNIFNGQYVFGTDIMNVKTVTTGVLNRDSKAVNYSAVTLALPGYNNSNTIGVSPIFNESPGIFYMAGKPKVSLKSISGNLGHEYTLDLSSVRYMFNPHVLGYAEIHNISQEIVAKDLEDGKSVTETKVFTGQVLRSNKPLSIIGIRVAFDVVPKNGSKKVRIVKTFSADLIK
jgi:hypothetical protein